MARLKAPATFTDTLYTVIFYIGVLVISVCMGYFLAMILG